MHGMQQLQRQQQYEHARHSDIIAVNIRMNRQNEKKKSTRKRQKVAESYAALAKTRKRKKKSKMQNSSVVNHLTAFRKLFSENCCIFVQFD